MTLDEKSKDEMASFTKNEDAEGTMTTLEQYDVLLGRGIGPNEHPGNIRYRTIVQGFQEEYLATNKRKEKEKIAKKAIDMVKANGARFLRQVVDATSPLDGEDKKPMRLARKRYTVAETDIVLEKTKQSLRFQGHKNKFPNGSNNASTESKKEPTKVASDEVLSSTESSTGPLHSTNNLLGGGAAVGSVPPPTSSSRATPMGSMVGGPTPAMAASQDMLLKALLSTLPNYAQQQQQQQQQQHQSNILSTQQDILSKVSALLGGAPVPPREPTPTSSTSQMDLLLQHMLRQNNSSPSTMDAHNLMATLQKLSKPAVQPQQQQQQQPASLSLPQLQQLLTSGNLQMQNNLATRGDMATQLMNLLQSQQQPPPPQPPAPAPVPTASNGFLPASTLSTFGQDPASLLQLFAAASSPGASEALRAMLR